MRRKTVSIALAVAVLVIVPACHARKPAIAGPRGVTYHGGDGSDCKHAVIVKGADGETRLSEAQAAWLAARYPGYTKVKAEATDSKPPETMITIKTADGQEKAVCFSGS